MSKLMSWHLKNISQDGLVKHLCDFKAWKHIHEKYPTFVAESKNVHLGLVVDGVNPFKLIRSNWSTWLVMLNYNLPPWLTTNKFFIMLGLLIPGKEFMIGENFDVYLHPFIGEFQKKNKQDFLHMMCKNP